MTTLDLAIAVWETGTPISLDIAVKLMEQGMDVQALEDKYFQH